MAQPMKEETKTCAYEMPANVSFRSSRNHVALLCPATLVVGQALPITFAIELPGSSLTAVTGSLLHLLMLAEVAIPLLAANILRD